MEKETKIIKDLFLLSVKSLTTRRLRSWLTVSGMIIGVAAIISLMSLGAGLEQEIVGQFNAVGADKIFISPGSSSFSSIATTAKLRDSDLKAISSITGIKRLEGLKFKIAETEYKGEKRFFFITSVSEDIDPQFFDESFAAGIVSGRHLESGDTNKAIIGWALANQDVGLGKKLVVGDSINIAGTEFDIVGIIGRRGNSQDDTSIIITEEDFEDHITNEDSFGFIIVQVEDVSETGAIADRISRELRKERDLEEGEEDFTIQTSDQLLESFGNILTIVQAVLLGIAAISMLVGGVGVANTMFTSVVERKRNIGIMKALGARNATIFTMFLLEAGIVGIIGGSLGILLGLGLGYIAAYVAFFVFGFFYAASAPSAGIIALGFGFSFIIGIVSGMFPAWKASMLNPVDAIRRG